MRSDDPSSRHKITHSPCVLAAMLSSCSARKRSPLNVESRMTTRFSAHPAVILRRLTGLTVRRAPPQPG